MDASNIRNVILVGAVVALVAAVAIYRQSGQTTATDVRTSGAAGLPRMLDLGSDKCIPCKEMAPILAELKKVYAGRAAIEFIDVWEDAKAAEPYGVRVIPTQIFFDRTGKEVWRHEGFLERADIVAKLKELGAG